MVRDEGCGLSICTVPQAVSSVLGAGAEEQSNLRSMLSLSHSPNTLCAAAAIKEMLRIVALTRQAVGVGRQGGEGRFRTRQCAGLWATLSGRTSHLRHSVQRSSGSALGSRNPGVSWF